MKLLILSDLHVEYAPFVPDRQAVAAADVVVLAGDIDVGTEGLSWAARTFIGKPIVYVAGNHEFYRGHWDTTLQQLRARAAELVIHFLENDAVQIGHVRFLGCTLWTDFALTGENQKEQAMCEASHSMADYRCIQAGSPARRLTPNDTIERHRQSRAWLERELAASAPRTVVVTHHLPHGRSVSPKYEGDTLNPAFASDPPTALLQRADLWIHGHTHESARYVVEGGERSTLVVCNPRGYGPYADGFENTAFNPGLVLDV